MIQIKIKLIKMFKSFTSRLISGKIRLTAIKISLLTQNEYKVVALQVF